MDDVEGCIFSQNLLVEDATLDEINEAVAGVAAGGDAAAGDDAAAAVAADSTCAAQVTSTVTVNAAAATQAADCPVQVTSTITVDASGATQAPVADNAEDAAADATVGKSQDPTCL